MTSKSIICLSSFHLQLRSSLQQEGLRVNHDTCSQTLRQYHICPGLTGGPEYWSKLSTLSWTRRSMSHGLGTIHDDIGQTHVRSILGIHRALSVYTEAPLIYERSSRQFRGVAEMTENWGVGSPSRKGSSPSIPSFHPHLLRPRLISVTLWQLLLRQAHVDNVSAHKLLKELQAKGSRSWATDQDGRWSR